MSLAASAAGNTNITGTEKEQKENVLVFFIFFGC